MATFGLEREVDTTVHGRTSWLDTNKIIDGRIEISDG